MNKFKFANLSDFRGKKVLIMGLGVLGGGAGLARFFVELGAKVMVTDLKSEMDLAVSLESLKGLPITYVLGRHEEKDFLESDLIIRNPDVSKDSPYLKIAREAGVPVEMDESLFLQLCPVPVIGVTGTRGKTTTTTLIGEVLKKAGYPTLLGGNLQGIATLSLLSKITPKSRVVLELSSWQLQSFEWDKIASHIAVVTNIYPDHLNRYQSMDDYIADKKLIFKYQNSDDFLVLNKENEITRSFANKAKARVVWFKKDDWPKEWILKIPGDHNRENAAAALAVAQILGIDKEIVKEAVCSFGGVPHRIETIRELGGVTFINDTAATMPVAGIAALRAFNGKPIILICGGNTKKLDLTDFAKEITQKAKAVVLLEGTATDELQSSIINYKSSIKILGRFNDFKSAILTTKMAAKPGDVILLSPGCTSFGMFKNEFDRGEQFKRIVNQL